MSFCKICQATNNELFYASITDENLIEQHRLTMEELDRELGL